MVVKPKEVLSHVVVMVGAMHHNVDINGGFLLEEEVEEYQVRIDTTRRCIRRAYALGVCNVYFQTATERLLRGMEKDLTKYLVIREPSLDTALSKCE